MRIIVTRQGDEVLKKLAEDQQTRSLKEEEEKLIKKKFDNSQIKEEKLNLSTLKELTVKQASIPKNISEKYNNDYKASTLLPSLNITRNNNHENEGGNINKNYTLRDIFKKSAIDDLKKEIVNSKKLKDKLSKIDETKFRSLYVSKSKLEILEEKLQKEVHPDKINLIKYLNQKEKITETLIDKLSTADDNKEKKFNKICQIVFQKNEEYNLFNQTAKQSIHNSRNKEKIEYKSDIERMGSSLNRFTTMLMHYPKNENHRKKFKDKHTDLEKNFWKKYHVNRLQRTKWKYSNQNSIDETYI